MKKLTSILAGALLLYSSVFAQSADDEEFAEAPLPPDLPESMESGKIVEPQVTIIRTEKQVIEEYRLNGHLYKIKVTPAVGPVYYLIDEDGDGNMEKKMSDIYNTERVPQWVLFKW